MWLVELLSKSKRTFSDPLQLTINMYRVTVVITLYIIECSLELRYQIIRSFMTHIQHHLNSTPVSPIPGGRNINVAENFARQPQRRPCPDYETSMSPTKKTWQQNINNNRKHVSCINIHTRTRTNISDITAEQVAFDVVSLWGVKHACFMVSVQGT